MRIRTGFGLFIAAILFVPASPRRARCDAGALPWLEPARLAGVHRDCAAVDIGGDGTTEILIPGAPIVNGTFTTPGVHLVAPTPDGGFALLESLNLDTESPAEGLGDIDGDGWTDIVGFAGWSLCFYRQAARGFEWAGSIDARIPGSLQIERAQAFPVEDGLVFASCWSWIHELDRTVLGGELVRWEPGPGFVPVWTDTISSDAVLSHSHTFSAIWSGPSGRFAIATEDAYHTSRVWALSIGDSGFGALSCSRQLPGGDPVLSSFRIAGERRIILWSQTAGDSIYDVVPSPDTVLVYPRRIQGMPRLFRGDGTVFTMPLEPGGAIAAASRIDSLGPCMPFVRFDAEGARCMSRVRLGESDWPVGLVSSGGQIRVLANRGETIHVISGSPAPRSAPDVSLDVDAVITDDDMDGDGRRDLIWIGSPPGSPIGAYMSSGIDHPPWFGPPEAVTDRLPRWLGFRDRYGACADLDGDGARDLLMFSSNGDTVIFHPFFRDGSGFEPGSPCPALFEDYKQRWVCLADFDGDGRSEIVYRRSDLDDRLRLLRWNRDRTIDTSVGSLGRIAGTPKAVGDFDADGVPELVVDSGYCEIYGIYPQQRTIRRLASFDVDHSRWSDYDFWPRDVDGDGSDEIIQDSGVLTIIDPAPDLRSARTVRGCALPVAMGAEVMAIDLDSDGSREMLIPDRSMRYVATVEDPLGPESEARLWDYADPWVQPVNGVSTVWTDLDRDGDVDFVWVCEDGIRVTLSPIVSGAAAGGAGPLLRIVSASPGGPSARIAVRLPRAGSVSAGLFDVTGRRLWSESRTAPAGDWLEFLIAPRPAGGEIARGIYFVKVEGGGRVATKRILLGF